MNRKVSQNGAEIRRLRKENLGLSVPAFAARVGIRGQSLSNIELDNKPVGLTTLIRIAKELGVPIEAILASDEAEVGAAA
jgi:transcriptional regulator with XRE-family HTH domain